MSGSGIEVGALLRVATSGGSDVHRRAVSTGDLLPSFRSLRAARSSRHAGRQIIDAGQQITSPNGSPAPATRVAAAGSLEREPTVPGAAMLSLLPSWRRGDSRRPSLPSASEAARLRACAERKEPSCPHTVRSGGPHEACGGRSSQRHGPARRTSRDFAEPRETSQNFARLRKRSNTSHSFARYQVYSRRLPRLRPRDAPRIVGCLPSAAMKARGPAEITPCNRPGLSRSLP